MNIEQIQNELLKRGIVNYYDTSNTIKRNGKQYYKYLYTMQAVKTEKEFKLTRTYSIIYGHTKAMQINEFKMLQKLEKVKGVK